MISSCTVDIKDFRKVYEAFCTCKNIVLTKRPNIFSSTVYRYIFNCKVPMLQLDYTKDNWNLYHICSYKHIQ